MRSVLVIGGSGTIGSAVVRELGKRHRVITAGRSGGDHRVAIEDIASVRALFAEAGRVDDVVVAAGALHVGPLQEMTHDQFRIGLASKLMGQVNVALVAQHALNDGGSITLTSGVDAHNPLRGCANTVAVNHGIEGFARGAAIELPRGLRINVVNPSLLEESAEKFESLFYGFEPVQASRVARAYSRCVDGAESGKTYRAW
ncbi:MULTISPECIES: short chain dehydrogenase [unclassified Duganella]|uniref:short chain dehydrogenase n=1 Tax=unclassified Duganella TaxID=2636909 RepID=UPI0006F2E1BB|nr:MULTISPECIES: short chain dehydrogenase [unclassified Duganella]KQV54121.1 short-chain dehydrogenase [Duganella sp. Root336D2]KRB95589.1 short-chain dehydrogenase [Duganella sp. Root198D2]